MTPEPMQCSCDRCGADMTDKWPIGIMVIKRGSAVCEDCSDDGHGFLSDWEVLGPLREEDFPERPKFIMTVPVQ